MSKFVEQRLQEAVYLKRGKNLFNKNAVTAGVYLDVNGDFLNGSNYSTSDFIPVLQEAYAYQGLTKIASNSYSAFYDKDKTLLQTFKQLTNAHTLEIPASAYYVRFTIHNDDLDTFQIEQNSTATSYEAYVQKKLLDVKGEEIVNLDKMKAEIEETGKWKNVELQILDSDCNNTRTFLRVNEKLRLAILQICYAKTNITTTANIVRIPQQYAPSKDDINWFSGNCINGGNITARFAIRNDGGVGIVANATNTNNLFGRIVYDY